jgi:membrane-associated phospholipid phosphatase
VVRSRLGCLVLIAAGCAAPAVAQTDTSFAPPTPDLEGERPFTLDGFEGGDGVRTMGAFPRNLGRGFVSVFGKDSLKPFLIGAAAAGISSSYDMGMKASFGGQAQGFGRVGGKAGGATVMVPLTAGLFLAGRATHDNRFRAATYDVAQAAIVSMTYTSLIKSAAQRPRPDGSNTLSFPSGHTSGAFAMASVFDAHYGPKVGIPAYAAAAAIGLSRIESNKHHLSDVLAGATLGYLVGHSVSKSNGLPDRGREPRFTIAPATDASGTGVGAGFSYSW